MSFGNFPSELECLCKLPPSYCRATKVQISYFLLLFPKQITTFGPENSKLKSLTFTQQNYIFLCTANEICNKSLGTKLSWNGYGTGQTNGVSFSNIVDLMTSAQFINISYPKSSFCWKPEVMQAQGLKRPHIEACIITVGYLLLSKKCFFLQRCKKIWVFLQKESRLAAVPILIRSWGKGTDVASSFPKFNFYCLAFSPSKIDQTKNRPRTH